MNGSLILNREYRIVKMNYIKEGSNSDSECAVQSKYENIGKKYEFFWNALQAVIIINTALSNFVTKKSINCKKL